jgi:dATP pyrophosphohydrolase
MTGLVRLRQWYERLNVVNCAVFFAANLTPTLMRHRLVDVYPYRIGTGREVEYLLLRRAASIVYAGDWRMVGGKIERGETAWQAALRELEEETGLTPACLWVVPSVNSFYEWETDRVHQIPAFAAELDGDPVLNHEHDAFVWLSAEDATGRLVWPEQRRLLRLVGSSLRDGVASELLVVPGSTE